MGALAGLLAPFRSAMSGAQGIAANPSLLTDPNTTNPVDPLQGALARLRASGYAMGSAPDAPDWIPSPAGGTPTTQYSVPGTDTRLDAALLGRPGGADIALQELASYSGDIPRGVGGIMTDAESRAVNAALASGALHKNQMGQAFNPATGQVATFGGDRNVTPQSFSPVDVPAPAGWSPPRQTDGFPGQGAGVPGGFPGGSFNPFGGGMGFPGGGYNPFMGGFGGGGFGNGMGNPLAGGGNMDGFSQFMTMIMPLLQQGGFGGFGGGQYPIRRPIFRGSQFGGPSLMYPAWSQQANRFPAGSNSGFGGLRLY